MCHLTINPGAPCLPRDTTAPGDEVDNTAKMEDFLATVRSISSDKNYVQLADYLNRSNELLVKCAGQLDAAIASLDPDQHSLAFMALL